MQVESEGDVNAHGDQHLTDHAYGPMQIRQPVCDDVNAAFGTHFRAEDMLGYTAKSLAVFWLYQSIYATTARLGRLPTNEDRARIWNGGPSAWSPTSKLYVATTEYWNKVRRYLS